MSYTPSGTYTYVVTITNSSLGCSDTASVNIIVDTCTGIGEISDGNDQLNIFPNPTTGLINISGTENINKDYKIFVFDIYGKLLLSENTLSFIDLSSYDNGLYFLQVQSDHKIMNEKILVSK